MNNEYKKQIQNLVNKKITSLTQESDSANVCIAIEGGAKIYSSYWRLLIKKGERLSSFDHKQQYGLPAPINAVEELKNKVVGASINEIKYVEESDDIELSFLNNLKLQIFNFSGYEAWELALNKNESVYSNYN